MLLQSLTPLWDALAPLVSQFNPVLTHLTPWLTLSLHPYAFHLAHLVFCLRLCMNEHDSLVKTVVFCFGGTTVAAMLLAVPAFVVTSPWALAVLLFAYSLAHSAPSLYCRLGKAAPVHVLLGLGADLACAFVFHTWMTRAEDQLVHNVQIGSCLIGLCVASAGFVLHSLCSGTEPDLTRVPSRFVVGVLLSRLVRFGLESRSLAHVSLAAFFVLTGLAS